MSGGRIPRTFIDDLLARVDLVDLIDTHVPLKKTGANYVARCPFHTEKTPSFSVNRNKQFYHCFGCGVSGNAISFLMDFNHLDFVEAVEDLATFAGLEVPREAFEKPDSGNKGDLPLLYRTMEQVAAFYTEQLNTHPEGKKALGYLQNRGVSGEVIADYVLGYAPLAWKKLQERFDSQRLQTCGLLGRNEEGDLYGRFRGRVMFPIRDKRGRVIGFGGRILDDSLPKYLNSPETPLFQKGREVYGLYELLRKNSKPQRILVVEGYMDVIALAQFGIHYAVATLGTATSQAHLELLFRFTGEVVLCFDGDKAGREAAWRAMEPIFPCLRDGRQVRIMLLPQNEDPDSLIRKEGETGFANRLQAAETLSDYFFTRLSSELNLSRLEDRAQLVNRAKPYLDKLPQSIFREMMFARLRELTEYRSLDVSENTAKLKRKYDRKPLQEKGRPSSARTALALLVQNPRLVELIEQKEIDWNELDFPGVELFKDILHAVLANTPATAGALLEIFREKPEEKSVKALALLPLLVPPDGLEAEFSDALDRLLAQSRSSVLDKLLAKEQSAGLDRREKDLLRKLLAHTHK
ncbi:DNA primase [Methylosarcina fibrata]|uniref:DNA primase n=1 Tax=Methylosarcina fibrata TaxID=105972 RepID=UPI00036CC854|nr:DNA primase [Methylosarcina fibrata]